MSDECQEEAARLQTVLESGCGTATKTTRRRLQVNGSSIAVLAPSKQDIGAPKSSGAILSGTHNTGGMSFGNSHAQSRQCKHAWYSQDGLAIVSNRTRPKAVRFHMLPGGRWVEETVYQRIVSGNRLDCDPR